MTYPQLCGFLSSSEFSLYASSLFANAPLQSYPTKRQCNGKRQFVRVKLFRGPRTHARAEG